MTDADGLAGRKILEVEDDYMIASELADILRDEGAEVIGPVASLEEATQLVHTAQAIDGALLDVNLRGEMAFPVADALLEREVPFVFATGYGGDAIPARYAHVTRCEKPVTLSSLARALFG